MVGGSLQVLWLLPPLKTGRHDIAEILLKVALHTKNLNQIKSKNRNTMVFGIEQNFHWFGPKVQRLLLEAKQLAFILRWLAPI